MLAATEADAQPFGTQSFGTLAFKDQDDQATTRSIKEGLNRIARQAAALATWYSSTWPPTARRELPV
jgi:hypothetical protein